MGAYTANDSEEKTAADLWLRFGGEAGFRFTPAFTISANMGLRQFQNKSSGNALYSGFYLGLGARINFELGGKSSGGAGASLDQDGPVYPVLTPLYQKYPIGTVSITNHENAEIRNVRLSFRAGNYSASEYPCGQTAFIQKGRSADLPLYADFSQEILRFADSGRILGELVIRYSLLGREIEAVRTVSVAVHNRNTVAPGDRASLAAFISPSSPEVLQFSKYVTGLARTKHRTGLNYNMEFCIWLLEGMRIAGVREDASLGARESRGFAPEAQFPSQTLAYGSGSLLDITLLYAAALEAVGIPAALIIAPDGDLLCAVDLGINYNDPVTEALFNGADKLLILGDEVWLPVSLSRFSEGFFAAWQEGVSRLDRVFKSGENVEVIIVEDAWELYPPVSFPSPGIHVDLPETEALARASEAALQSYINSELLPKIYAIRDQIRSRPDAALYNQLGNVYLRSGMISDAKAAYEQAAGMGFAGAMVNRGNVALNENDFMAAERWYRQALSREPGNRSALNGLENLETRK